MRSQQNSSENAALCGVHCGAEKGHDTAHSLPITSGHVKRGILLRPPWSAANEKEELKKWAGYKMVVYDCIWWSAAGMDESENLEKKRSSGP